MLDKTEIPLSRNDIESFLSSKVWAVIKALIETRLESNRDVNETLQAGTVASDQIGWLARGGIQELKAILQIPSLLLEEAKAKEEEINDETVEAIDVP